MLSKIKSSVVLIMTFVLLLTACSSSNNTPASSPSNTTNEASTTAETVELTISAAASLTDALHEIKELYSSTAENVSLNFNFGASGALQQQIEQGAPADLFLSAATKNMNALVEAQLIEEQTSLLKNDLVVVISASNEATISSLNDLEAENIVKIAIGIPESVPAGNYAKEALTNVNLWDSLQDKTVQAKDVRQVLQYVETSNVDAGFVYKTDALTSDKIKIAFAVDPNTYAPVVYPIGIVKATKHQAEAEAEAFYEYLQSSEALNVFEKYGFSISE